MPHRRTRDAEPMGRILHWAVQSQDQWGSISTGLSLDRHRGWLPHPSQRSGGCSTIIEERKVSWNRQHPSRTGPSRWRGCNHRSHDNLQQDSAERRMANPMDPVLSHHTSQERQPAAELPKKKASSVTKAKSCWRSYWTDWSHKRRRNISSTGKTSTMSSYTSGRPSTGFGMQLCGQP